MYMNIYLHTYIYIYIYIYMYYNDLTPAQAIQALSTVGTARAMALYKDHRSALEMLWLDPYVDLMIYYGL